MSETKKVTVNIPTHVLEQAMEATGKGVTATIVSGLEELERQRKRNALRRLKGKIAFDLDLEATRA